jgi:hypothetical protein
MCVVYEFEQLKCQVFIDYWLDRLLTSGFSWTLRCLLSHQKSSHINSIAGYLLPYTHPNPFTLSEHERTLRYNWRSTLVNLLLS